MAHIFNTDLYSLTDLILWGLVMLIFGTDIGATLNNIRNHKPNKTKRKEEKK